MVATAMIQDAEFKSRDSRHNIQPKPEIERWASRRFDLHAETLGFDEAVAKLLRDSRFAELIAEVRDALGSAAALVVWNENDEGFRVVRNGVDPVVWLHQLAKTESYGEILSAARALGLKSNTREN